jgi:hypothetical protein
MMCKLLRGSDFIPVVVLTGAYSCFFIAEMHEVKVISTLSYIN